MESLLLDLRYGVRMLLKNPGFGMVAIIALALGMIGKGRGRMPGYAKMFNPVQVGQLISYVRALTRAGGKAKRDDDSGVPPPGPGISSQSKSVTRPTNSFRGTARLKP